MSGGDFFDTRLFVCLYDDSDPAEQQRARWLVSCALAEGDACISFRVVPEALQVLTGKSAARVTPDTALLILKHALLPLWRVQPSAALYSRAVDVHHRRFALHDSLIVAAALKAGCARLLSEDLRHGRQIDGLRIENPFRAQAT